MPFYERYVELCSEHGTKPQTPEMQRIAGVTSGSISGWKQGSLPKVDVVCRLAEHFDVTADYLLGLSEVRKPVPLSEHEKLLIEAYRQANPIGQMNIIQVCTNERDLAEKRDNDHVG